MIALLLLHACGGEGEAARPDALPEAAQKVTFATVADLGSYHLKASAKRTTTPAGGAPRVTTEVVEIRWRDADHWSYTHGRDGRVRSEVVVWDAVAFAGSGGRPPKRKGDAEAYRVQLASVWDPWAWGLESLANAIVHQPGEVELVDGRRVRRHTLAAAPPPAKPKPGPVVTAVSGDVWIDEETAVRLKGQVSVDTSGVGSTDRVELLFSIDGIGVDPGVSAPPEDKR